MRRQIRETGNYRVWQTPRSFLVVARNEVAATALQEVRESHGLTADAPSTARTGLDNPFGLVEAVEHAEARCSYHETLALAPARRAPRKPGASGQDGRPGAAAGPDTGRGRDGGPETRTNDRQSAGDDSA